MVVLVSRNGKKKTKDGKYFIFNILYIYLYMYTHLKYFGIIIIKITDTKFFIWPFFLFM